MKAEILLKTIDVLVVEDNPADVTLLKELFRRGALNARLHTVGDGVEAIDFIHKRGKYASVPRPSIIFLDLNLPKKDGHTVLKELKSDPEMRSIPIIVLTSSQVREDIRKSYDSGANSYIVKPSDLSLFDSVVHSLQAFWFRTCQLPDGARF